VDQLFFVSVVFGPPAVILLVAQACRLGLNRLIASFMVLAIMVGSIIWAWFEVAETYARFGESEGNGAVASFCFFGAIWFVGAAASLWMIMRMNNVRSARS
jgi:hypothetical protein